MPLIELTDEELGHLCAAVERGVEALGEQLDDYREKTHYSEADWVEMQQSLARWGYILDRIAAVTGETSDANE